MADETVNSGPEPAAVGDARKFKIKVAFDNQQLGWWTDKGMWGGYYIAATKEEKDATVWEWIEHSASHYLKKGTDNYLGADPALKMVNWIAADAWRLEGNRLRCVRNDQLVGVKGGYFYAAGVNVVSVEFVYIV